MTSLPTWAVWTLSFGSPALTFLGLLISQVFSPEKRSKREEVLNHLRWASELAVSQEKARHDLGIIQLTALLRSKLLDDTDKDLVELALSAALERVVEEAAEKAKQTGELVQFVLTTDLPAVEEVDVTSDEGAEGEEGSR